MTRVFPPGEYLSSQHTSIRIKRTDYARIVAQWNTLTNKGNLLPHRG